MNKFQRKWMREGLKGKHNIGVCACVCVCFHLTITLEFLTLTWLITSFAHQSGHRTWKDKVFLRPSNFLLTLSSILHVFLSAISPVLFYPHHWPLTLKPFTRGIWELTVVGHKSLAPAVMQRHQNSCTLRWRNIYNKNQTTAVNPNCHWDFWPKTKIKNLLAELEIKQQHCHLLGTIKKPPNTFVTGGHLISNTLSDSLGDWSWKITRVKHTLYI